MNQLKTSQLTDKAKSRGELTIPKPLMR